jgi:hypothetical protein
MKRHSCALALMAGLLLAMCVGQSASAQKSGGILHVHAIDSPPSMSMHEEVDAVPARKLAEDGARPIIFYNRFAYCWQPKVKGWTMMANSIINNWRLEDAWLDK